MAASTAAVAGFTRNRSSSIDGLGEAAISFFCRCTVMSVLNGRSEKMSVGIRTFIFFFGVRDGPDLTQNRVIFLPC